MKRFKPVPLTELLEPDHIAALKENYGEFENLTPIEDIYLSEPSMMGVMEIQESAGTPRALISVIQEALLTRERKVCWSRQFIETLPGSVALPIALKCKEKLQDLFQEYSDQTAAGEDQPEKKD